MYIQTHIWYSNSKVKQNLLQLPSSQHITNLSNLLFKNDGENGIARLEYSCDIKVVTEKAYKFDTGPSQIFVSSNSHSVFKFEGKIKIFAAT